MVMKILTKLRNSPIVIGLEVWARRCSIAQEREEKIRVKKIKKLKIYNLKLKLKLSSF